MASYPREQDFVQHLLRRLAAITAALLAAFFLIWTERRLAYMREAIIDVAIACTLALAGTAIGTVRSRTTERMS